MSICICIRAQAIIVTEVMPKFIESSTGSALIRSVLSNVDAQSAVRFLHMHVHVHVHVHYISSLVWTLTRRCAPSRHGTTLSLVQPPLGMLGGTALTISHPSRVHRGAFLGHDPCAVSYTSPSLAHPPSIPWSIPIVHP